MSLFNHLRKHSHLLLFSLCSCLLASNKTLPAKLLYSCAPSCTCIAGSKRATSVITNPAVAAAAAAHMLSWEDALWLATAGGAAALSLKESVGYFAVGMEFDALLVDAGVPGGPFDVMMSASSGQQQQLLLLLEQFLNNGDDRNITEVYVQGRRCV
jgi:hypothetical protein